jgi:hypothetical protein
MPYAINLADLTKVDPFIVGIFITPHRGELVSCEPGRGDGMGVSLKCNDSIAMGIVGTLHQKYHCSQMRCYYSKTGKGWQPFTT